KGRQQRDVGAPVQGVAYLVVTREIDPHIRTERAHENIGDLFYARLPAAGQVDCGSVERGMRDDAVDGVHDIRYIDKIPGFIPCSEELDGILRFGDLPVHIPEQLFFQPLAIGGEDTQAHRRHFEKAKELAAHLFAVYLMVPIGRHRFESCRLADGKRNGIPINRGAAEIDESAPGIVLSDAVQDVIDIRHVQHIIHRGVAERQLYVGGAGGIDTKIESGPGKDAREIRQLGVDQQVVLLLLEYDIRGGDGMAGGAKMPHGVTADKTLRAQDEYLHAFRGYPAF